MMSAAFHVNLANNRWALKVLYNPVSCSSSSYVIRTIPSSRTNRPQTMIEINSSRPRHQCLLIIRQHFLTNTRASILQFDNDSHPILTADVVAQTIDPESLSPLDFCSICLGEFHRTETVLQLNCQHIYHRQCLLPWLERHFRCPYCRFLVYQPAVTPHLFLVR